MAKVTNLTDRGLPLLRWRILPKNQGGLINPKGDIVQEMPADVAYSPQAKRLADAGVLFIEGYSKKPKPKLEGAPGPAGGTPTLTEPEAAKTESAPEGGSSDDASEGTKEEAEAGSAGYRRRKGSKKGKGQG